jgi:hypothetical protein
MSVARRMGVDLHQPYPREPWHVEARKSFALLAPGVRGVPLKTRPLLRTMKDAGIVDPKTTVEAAHAVGLPLAIACALLEQESSGGHNVFGHDAVRNPIKGGPVTRERYAQYLAHRRAGEGMQGVGPCQLTWFAFQDRADLLGGCWKPAANMRVGFAILKGLIQRDGIRTGCRAYNGTGPGAERYADQVVARIAKWRQILS